jgi:hypothetical protein
MRLFTPTILDWSGAKFSKSLYINNPQYLDNYIDFLSLTKLVDRYGFLTLEKLYFECASWVMNSNKFFRNYTIDYFKQGIFS